MTTATQTTTKTRCPICSKLLSYNGSFSKHGYQIRYRQHTASLCYGAYKEKEGLVQRYVAQLGIWMESESGKFPAEWLDMKVFHVPGVDRDGSEYRAYRTYIEIKRERAFFEKML